MTAKERFDRLQGHRTYTVVLVLTIAMLIYLAVLAARIAFLPTDRFLEALEPATQVIPGIGEFMMWVGIGLGGSKFGSASKEWVSRRRHRDLTTLPGEGDFANDDSHNSDFSLRD